MTSQTSLRGDPPHWSPTDMLGLRDDDETESDESDPQAYLIFELGRQRLAVTVAQVREILDDLEVTPLPKAPMDVEGMIDLRGHGVCVVDLRGRLGIPPAESRAAHRIVVFEFTRPGAAPLPIGVRTDAVRDVCLISPEAIEAKPESLQDWDGALIDGVTRLDEKIVVLVNLGAVFETGNAAGMFDFP
ncbi:MAG: chemotaxis protein CheW [Roseovarius sp.]